MHKAPLIGLHPLACPPYHCDFSEPRDCGEDDDHSSTEQITPFPALPTTSALQNGWTVPIVVSVGLFLALVAALSVFVVGPVCAALLVDALIASYRDKKWHDACESRAAALVSEIERRLLADAPQARVMFDIDDAVAQHMERNRPLSMAHTLWRMCTNKTGDAGKVTELYVMTSPEGDEAVYAGAQVRRVWTRLFEAPHGRGLWGSAFCGEAHYPLGSIVLFRAVKHIDDLYAFLGIGEEADRVRHHVRVRRDALWRRRDAAKKAARRALRAACGPPRPPTLFSRPP